VPGKPESEIDLDDILLGPDDELPSERCWKERKAPKRVEPLQRLPGAFVRVPIQWLCQPVRKRVVPPQWRLFLYVLYRSHWGQRGVVVTDKVAAEVNIGTAAQTQASGAIRARRLDQDRTSHPTRSTHRVAARDGYLRRTNRAARAAHLLLLGGPLGPPVWPTQFSSFFLSHVRKTCSLSSKPKGMRWKTYWRIDQQIDAGRERLDVVFAAGAQRILTRLERAEHRSRRRRWTQDLRRLR
jgi:hypothetical protein